MSTTHDYIDPEAFDGAWGSYPYDLRGTPKGQAVRWHAERLILKPRRKRRTREKLEIAYCAEGWYSSSGSPTKAFGDSICQCIDERKLWHRYSELHPEPVVWRIRKYDGRWQVTCWYCDAYLPGDIRELAVERTR